MKELSLNWSVAQETPSTGVSVAVEPVEVNALSVPSNCGCRSNGTEQIVSEPAKHVALLNPTGALSSWAGQLIETVVNAATANMEMRVGFVMSKRCWNAFP